MRAACVLLLLAASLGLAAAQFDLPPECSHLTDLFALIGSTDDIYANCPPQSPDPNDPNACDEKAFPNCKPTLKKVRRRRRRAGGRRRRVT